jgi:hypothetical protein
LQKIGCYRPTPFKMNLAPEIQTDQKRTGKLGLQLFFSFPCTFFLGMVTPLILAHLDPFVLGNSLKSLQDLDRALLI